MIVGFGVVPVDSPLNLPVEASIVKILKLRPVRGMGRMLLYILYQIDVILFLLSC